MSWPTPDSGDADGEGDDGGVTGLAAEIGGEGDDVATIEGRGLAGREIAGDDDCLRVELLEPAGVLADQVPNHAAERSARRSSTLV